MFSVLIWQDSCSYCPPFPAHVSSGWLCWLFVYYFAMPRALFISVPCILPSSSILRTFFCNWETSQFLSRLFSFLAFLTHWSFLTTFPLVLLGPKWNVRLLNDFEEITLDAAEQQVFSTVSHRLSGLTATGASHSYWNPTEFLGLLWITALDKREDAHRIVSFVLFPSVYTRIVPSDELFFAFTAKSMKYTQRS